MMKKLPLEIVIPIFNEGKKIIDLVKLLKKNVKINFRILLCYDNSNDDIFDYIHLLDNIDVNVRLIKNPSNELVEFSFLKFRLKYHFLIAIEISIIWRKNDILGKKTLF